MIVAISALVLFEVLLGQFKIFWLPVMFSASVLLLVVIPFTEILKTNLYLSRYKLLARS